VTVSLLRITRSIPTMALGMEKKASLLLDTAVTIRRNLPILGMAAEPYL
jgi:hypothetical protein